MLFSHISLLLAPKLGYTVVLAFYWIGCFRQLDFFVSINVFLDFLVYLIQHCFICRPAVSNVRRMLGWNSEAESKEKHGVWDPMPELTI